MQHDYKMTPWTFEESLLYAACETTRFQALPHYALI